MQNLNMCLHYQTFIRLHITERFSQDPLETYFANNILDLEKINYPSMTLIIPTLLKNKVYSSQ